MPAPLHQLAPSRRCLGALTLSQHVVGGSLLVPQRLVNLGRDCFRLSRTRTAEMSKKRRRNLPASRSVETATSKSSSESRNQTLCDFPSNDCRQATIMPRY